MGEFKSFVESNKSDVKESLRKLPDAHRALVRGFPVKFLKDGVLPGDEEHVGKIETSPKKITLAAPWFYPREFILIHEIGHLVWEKYVKGTPLEKEWNDLCAKTKGKVKQPNEELFCHSYANTYSHNKMEKHSHDAFEKFIYRLPK